MLAEDKKIDVEEQIITYCKNHIVSQDIKHPLYPVRLGAYELFKAQGLPTTRNEQWRYTNIVSKLEKIPSQSLSKPVPVNLDNFINNFEIVKKAKENNDSVLVFMDGAMQSQLSVVNSDTKTISVTSLKRDPIPDWAIKLNSKKHSQNMDELFNLNTTLMEDGAIINISNNKAIADTIYIIHVGLSLIHI